MSIKKLRSAAIVPEPMYVERAADRQLREIINEMGRPGYVLVARQMGKTNLLLHMKRERTDDIVLYHDLSNRFDNARLWFRNIIDLLIEAYGERFPSAATAIPKQRIEAKLEANVEFDRHLRSILKEVGRKVIIILDEIDSLVNTSYSDVILSQIRSMYFSRANYPEYENLTYVLSGVVEPTDLIKDKNISPFNIGEKIYLENFDFAEFNEFLMKADLDLSDDVIHRIFEWVNGNPRITWEVCAEIEEIVRGVGFVTVADVDSVISKIYLKEFDRPPVDHIRTLVRSDTKIRDAIIEIRYGKGDTLDQVIKNKLYLAGVIGSAGGTVSVTNRVIDAALSDTWLKSLIHAPVTSQVNDYYGVGNYGAVIERLENFVGASNDENFSSHDRHLLALSYLYTGKFPSAIRELKLCLSEASEPKAAQYLNFELGMALAADDKLDEAVAALGFAKIGPDRNTCWKAKLEHISIILEQGSDKSLVGLLKECGDLIIEISEAKNNGLLVEDVIRVFAHYIRSQLLFRLNKEADSIQDLESAIQMADSQYMPKLLLAKARIIKRRQTRVAIARQILDLIISKKVSNAHAGKFPLQLGSDQMAEVFLLLIEENLVQEFKDLANYYTDSVGEVNLGEFHGLKNLYDNFDGKVIQQNYIEILIWALRHFDDQSVDWKDRVEVYREIVAQYPGNDKNDFRNRYLKELEVHEGEAKDFFEVRHLEIMLLIGTACVQSSDWRLGRRLFDIWEKYRHLADPTNLYTLLLEYYCLLGTRAGQLFNSESSDVARRILKVIKENEEALRKGAQGETAILIKREAEAALRSSLKMPLTDQEIIKNLGRNDWVLVQYPGLPPEKTKIKHVSEDLKAGNCFLLEIVIDKK